MFQGFLGSNKQEVQKDNKIKGNHNLFFVISRW